MSRKSRWTNEEDEVLLAHIKENPANIRDAIRASCEELNRSFGACQNRWYTHISKNEDKYHTCFITLSRKQYAKNRKNVKKNIEETTKGSIWHRFMKLIFG